MSQDTILAANNQQFCCVSRISKNLCNTKSPTLNICFSALTRDGQIQNLNNIALIRDRSGYKPCPIFDCGASFLLDFALYSPEIESRAYLTKAQCLPFKSRFTQTVHTAQALYGKQLVVNIDKTSIDTILDKYLCYYPKQFHFLLKERIETVLMEQQKKLFEK